MKAIFQSFSDRAGLGPVFRKPLAAVLLPCLSIALVLGCTKTPSESAPAITSFTPDHGIVGSTVTVTGTGLLDTTAGTINGTTILLAVNNSDTTLTITVPPLATTGPIAVTSVLGSAASSTYFSVVPQITSISPTSGPAGTVVTLTGTGFTNISKVEFGTELSVPTGSVYTQLTGQQATAIVASDATTGPVVITASGYPSASDSTAPVFTVTQ